MSDNAVLLQGDCLEVLRELPDNSVDSLITDPPAGISFMSYSWDDDKGGRKQWTAWMAEVMIECLRVLKPGAHGLVWAIPRTSHWTASALEDAGFEIRDVITHVFGSGFPKSMNIEKTLGDKAKGMGTALKPASEHWILVRKPISEKTVAANVLQHGTGGINIDASRISSNGDHKRPFQPHNSGEEHNTYGQEGLKKSFMPTNAEGRFPANFILSHNPECTETCTAGCAIAELDRQANQQASRFFYVGKASKKDKGSENTHPTVKSSGLMTYLIKLITPPGGIVLDPFMGSGSTGVAATKAGFDFIGIEKEEEYFNISQKRVG